MIMTQSNLRGRFSSLYSLKSITKGNRPEPKQRPLRNAVYWLASHDLLARFVTQPKTTYPGVASTTVGCTLPCQLLVKMSHRLAHRAVR